MILPRDRRLRHLRPRPLLHLVPNMLTILGMCAGLTGLRYALDGHWRLAVGLIIAAVVFDGLDGRSARMLNLTSKLGEQLDSLADFLSFGVAPAVIVYLWVLNDVRALGWALAMLFATCCAMRLARFNAELEDETKPRWMSGFFSGIPAPAAASLALLPMIASFVLGDEIFRSWYLNALTLVFVSVMMVSRVPTFSAKKLRVAPDYVMPVLIAVGMLLVFLVTETWSTLLLVGLAYAATLPIAYLSARRMAAAEAAEKAERASATDKPEQAAGGTEGTSDGVAGRVVPLEKRGKS